jgi:hypothetical protein
MFDRTWLTSEKEWTFPALTTISLIVSRRQVQRAGNTHQKAFVAYTGTAVFDRAAGGAEPGKNRVSPNSLRSDVCFSGLETAGSGVGCRLLTGSGHSGWTARDALWIVPGSLKSTSCLSFANL